jgi:hypothetical protein
MVGRGLADKASVAHFFNKPASHTFTSGRAAVKVRPHKPEENPGCFLTDAGLRRNIRLAASPETSEPASHDVGFLESECRIREGTSSF